MGVYRKVPRRKCTEAGLEMIQVRWIGINKGDDKNPDYRSRLEAKAFKKDERPELFAATPALEALKVIISKAATVDEKDENKVLIVNDGKRAYFYANTKLEIPDEDKNLGDEDLEGKLMLSTYGPRDAAQNQPDTFASHLMKIGYRRGRSNECVFYHTKKGLQTMVRGDDYVTA
jgi:hypothetical protein